MELTYKIKDRTVELHYRKQEIQITTNDSQKREKINSAMAIDDPKTLCLLMQWVLYEKDEWHKWLYTKEFY